MMSQPIKLTPDQIKDAGLALLLIFLLIYRLGGQSYLFWPAVFVLLVVMTCPFVLKPWAKAWFALAQILGTFVSKIILSVVFFIVATPVGYIRRRMGADSLNLKRWKDCGDGSAFVVRRYTYTRKDLENPF